MRPGSTRQTRTIDLIASLLREAGHSLLLGQPELISRFLTRAKQFGKKVHQNATFELYAAATSGMRSSVAGEPFPRDMATKEQAEKVLKRLSRFAPEYEFYELIKKDAEREISHSLQQAELPDG